MSHQNQLYTTHFSKTVCSKFFPLTVEMEEGCAAQMPHLTRQPAPAEIEAVQPWTASKEDFTVVGLYSPKKLKEWRSKILFPSYREATLRRVRGGRYGEHSFVGIIWNE
ncbi:MAG: hypothetical protein GY696_07345 [Gammaproteobacteria bacterium]|nr:hypothetical protein [Gammaproteobacteria bacterium]